MLYSSVTLTQIAHDGSISPLLGFLQIAQMIWPGMGSEVCFLHHSYLCYKSQSQVVFELYSTGNNNSKAYFLRVLWGGQPMETSTPLGTLNHVPIQDFFDCKFLVCPSSLVTDVFVLVQ